MRTWRGIGTRIVASSISCGLLGLLVGSILAPGTRDGLGGGVHRMLFGAVAVTALAAAFGVVSVVRPLTRRLERLRTAVGRVGREGYASTSDTEKNEMGELSVILDEAHARIRADAAELGKRQESLERYLADIAHDLKTPIASLQIALGQAAEQSQEPALSDLLRVSIKDVVYLAGLTTNLRLACQLRDGWNPAAPGSRVDLSEVLERVVSRVRYFAKNRNMSLEMARPDGPTLVTCHPTAVEQTVTNLVENAVGYGDPGGHVAVVLTSHAGRFSLVVADDGPGVLPAELPRLRERTFRSDHARQRDPSGSGLGLAIASEICAHCGWSLEFERIEPRGLRVVIRGTNPPLEPLDTISQ